MLPVYRYIPLLAGLLLGACSSMPSAPLEQVEVHAMFGEREVVGVDCFVTNAWGRTPVIAPGRVTVRAVAPIEVTCSRPRTIWHPDAVAERPDMGQIKGKVVLGSGAPRIVTLPQVLSVPMRLVVPAPQAGSQALASRIF